MKYKMDISQKIREVYTKIAHWHNGDEANKTTLIMVSQEIVEDIINFTLSEMDIKTNSGVESNQGKTKEMIAKEIADKIKDGEKPKKTGFFGLFK